MWQYGSACSAGLSRSAPALEVPGNIAYDSVAFDAVTAPGRSLEQVRIRRMVPDANLSGLATLFRTL